MCWWSGESDKKSNRARNSKTNVLIFLNVCLWVKILFFFPFRLSRTTLMCTNTAIHCFPRWTETDGETLCCKYASGHSPCMAPVAFCFFSWLVLFPATQYLCYLCMTVYIYMVSSLSPVIDFAKLEINYQTSPLWTVIYWPAFVFMQVYFVISGCNGA